ncbi:MAG: rhodanese-related sulfurtransferase [Pseudomonadota bacterium]
MYTIAALYQFTEFEDPATLRPGVLAACQEFGISGTLLLAPEGLNGTLAGSREGIAQIISYLKNLPGCSDLEWKKSHSIDPPFNRMKVRLKKEIVTMGQPDVRPADRTGHYVDPKDWNALISQDDVVTIDTRNDYEVAIGSFKGAVDPETQSFGEFPEWWAKNRNRFEGKRIAMFCTGGIRCEKSTNYLLGQGEEEVFHLKGGILKYLEEVPEPESLWQGACFVFDSRVSVTHGLKVGEHALCYACRRPLEPADLLRESYEEGVSCHLCIHETSASDKERFRERQKQIALAKSRGVSHIGPSET